MGSTPIPGSNTELLGHVNINNNLVYTYLVNFESDGHTCKLAKTVKTTELIEFGFEYVTEVDDVKLFRKRK